MRLMASSAESANIAFLPMRISLLPEDVLDIDSLVHHGRPEGGPFDACRACYSGQKKGICQAGAASPLQLTHSNSSGRPAFLARRKNHWRWPSGLRDPLRESDPAPD